MMGLRESSGAGGISSNVLGYAKWLQCHIGRTKPLSEARHDALTISRMIISGRCESFESMLTYVRGVKWGPIVATET